MIFAAGTAKYDSDESLREQWRSHIRGRDPAVYPEIDPVQGKWDLRDSECRYFKNEFMSAYERWEKGILTDPRDRGFFMAHDAQIVGARPERIKRGGYYYLTGGLRATCTPIGFIVVDEGILPETVETTRTTWAADPSGLAAAGRLYTNGWYLHTGKHPTRQIGGLYDPQTKCCSLFTANAMLSDKHMAHAFIAHEQMGHASFFGGGLPYMESEFTRANPHGKFGHSPVARWGLNSEYIRTHPDELNVTYEPVASFSKDELPWSLAGMETDWREGDSYLVLEKMCAKGLLQWDERYSAAEHHLEFHPDSSGALAGLTVYRQRLSGDAQVARERFARFLRGIAETGGLTQYSWETLEKEGHAYDNFQYLRNWDPSYILDSMNENYAECTALFTAPDRSKFPGSKVTNFNDPKVREVEESWRDWASFIGARAIRSEKAYEYPY